MSTTPPSVGADGVRRKRRNSGPGGDERQTQKQRAQRTTMACERCRMKKLRCMGGHPCSACQRAKAECGFGDREPDSQHSISAANQRISQLEKTVAILVASLSRENSLFSPGNPAQSSAQSLDRPVNVADIPVIGRTKNAAICFESPPLTDIENMTAPSSSLPHPDMGLVALSGRLTMAPEATHSSSVDPRISERLESRWSSLQHDSAPFPALMSHPAAWSEGPVKTSPGGASANSTVGMVVYKAQVHLQSEPISEGIVDEVVSRWLFNLFFQKCHPSFPLLESYQDLDRHFEHIRTSSPFLFTSILAVAGRYYTGYRNALPATTDLPPITVNALEALAELACAHLGFVLFRKQHQLSDVQATLLLSVWIPRGKGQSADQWMISGLCSRLAHRIGIVDCWNRPEVHRFTNLSSPAVQDVQQVNGILPQWHTWLMLNQYDISLSLGFGRPHVKASTHTHCRQYLAVARKLGSSAQVDLAVATYVTSLVELSTITADLVSGLRAARLNPTSHQDAMQPTAATRTQILALLADLNPRLDEWERQWTWAGSYDAIMLGIYTKFAKVYGEHVRLCLNALSLNLITANTDHENQQNDLELYLAKACEAAISIVKIYAASDNAELFVRYGADYLVLIIAQSAVFFVRIITSRLEQALPVQQTVLRHYLGQAINLLESNDLSTTEVCGWMARLCRSLMRFTGLYLEPSVNLPDTNNSVVSDANVPEPVWDFDVNAFLSQNMPAGETGFDLGGYFDFTRSFFPAPSE